MKDINTMTMDELKAALAKATKPKAITFKVGEKGGVSVYGINTRFPVTLYGEQWLRLLAVADSLKQFIHDNQSKLATKE